MPVRKSARGAGRRARRPGRQPVVQDEEQEEEELTDGTLFSLGGDDKVVYVWRQHPVSKRPVFMFRLAQEEATEEEIQRLAGGGVYTCREKERNEAGVMMFGRQRTIEIGGRLREPQIPKATAEAEETSPGSTAPVVGTTPERKTTLDDVLTGGILRLFTSQAEASETQAKMYQTMMTRPQTDWGELLKAVAPIVVTLLKKDNKSDPLEMVTKIAELVKESTSSASSFKDTLSAMNDVLDIKERTAPVPEDAFTALAGNLPKILEIISSEQKSKGRMPTQEEVRRRLAPSSQPTGAEPMPAYAKLLNKFAPMLVRWAREGKDSSLMGEFLFSSIPTQYHGVVREFLLRDDAESLVYQTIPDLREFPEWTKDCFGTLAQCFGIGEVEDEESLDADDEVGGDDVESETVEEVTTETVEE